MKHAIQWVYGRRRVLAVALAKGSSSSGNILFQFFLIYTLSMAGVGQINFALALAMGVGVLLRGGMDIVVTREASSCWRMGRRGAIAPLMYKSISKIMLRFALVLLVSAIGVALFPERLSIWTVSVALMIGLLFTLLLVTSSVLKSIEEIVLGSWVEPGQPFLIAGGVGLLAFTLFGVHLDPYTGVLIAALVVVSAGLILSARKLADYPKEESPPIGAETVLFLISGIAYISQWGVIVIFAAFFGPRDVGLFSSALRFGLALNFLLMVTNQFVIPKISTFYRTGRLDEMEALVRRSATGLFAAGVAITLVIAAAMLLSNSVLFKDIGLLVVLILLGQLVNVSSGATGYVLSLTGNEGLLLKANVTSLAVGLLLISIAGLMHAPLVWAVLAYVSIPVLVTVISVVYIKRIFGFYCLPDFNMQRSRK